MSSSRTLPPVPVYRGTAAGIAAYTLGYAATYLLTISAVAGATLTNYIAAVTGEAAAWRVVGLVFYNAHFVDSLIPDLFGPGSVNLVLETPSLTTLVFLVPPALLLVAGAAVRVGGRVIPERDAARYGLCVMLGYMPATLVGAMTVTAHTGRGPAGPDPGMALIVVGVIYPLVFAPLGAIVGNRL